MAYTSQTQAEADRNGSFFRCCIYALMSLFLMLMAMGLAGYWLYRNFDSFNIPYHDSPPPEMAKLTLPEAKQGFETTLVKKVREEDLDPPLPPDESRLRRVFYISPAGRMHAYLSKRPGDGKKHPCIIWITGGFSNSLDPVWEKAPAENDQTAAVYREKGILTMYPSFRGGLGNPGHKEIMCGEVDDVLAALRYVQSLDYVDPARIYLGGHSTGGTLALLVAASTPDFRAVFAFGPVATDYGPDYRYYDTSITKEAAVRTPLYWLRGIRSPTFVIEGEEGNTAPLRTLRSVATAGKFDNLHFIEVAGADHFNVLGPANAILAMRILQDKDEGAKSNITFDEKDVEHLQSVIQKAKDNKPF
ncbi:peptidase [Verrucomicrobia bacterium LW23]|nr:peptidase [Verrucomicrobia bacterium LW23]